MSEATPVEDLTRVDLGTGALVLGQAGERVLVGHVAPQPGGNGVLLDRLQLRRDPGLAEILLRQDVGRDLRKLGRNVDVLEPEHDRSVGIADFARGLAEFQPAIGSAFRRGEPPFNAHLSGPLGFPVLAPEKLHVVARPGLSGHAGALNPGIRRSCLGRSPRNPRTAPVSVRVNAARRKSPARFS